MVPYCKESRTAGQYFNIVVLRYYAQLTYTVFMLIKRYKNEIHYRRIGIIEIPGNEFVSLDWIDRCNR